VVVKPVDPDPIEPGYPVETSGIFRIQYRNWISHGNDSRLGARTPYPAYLISLKCPSSEVDQTRGDKSDPAGKVANGGYPQPESCFEIVRKLLIGFAGFFLIKTLQ
jgi:hypothetical protein